MRASLSLAFTLAAAAAAAATAGVAAAQPADARAGDVAADAADATAALTGGDDDAAATAADDVADDDEAAAAAAPRTAAVEPLSAADTVATAAAAPAAATEPGAIQVGDVHFALHGYARMPLATQGTPRTPYLVDNDYYLSGFAYTRLYEPDWSELFLSASRGDYKAEFGLFASLYSDYASPRLENQLGIAQASVTAQRFLGVDPLSVQLGVFWDRFGHIEPYDTYVFGRTHQGGVKVAYDLPAGGKVQVGVGAHQELRQQNQGMTPIVHLAGAYPVGPVQVGGYLLRTWTRDKPQLSPVQDATMWVAGADARYAIPGDHGSAYAAFAYYTMDKALYLAPALEVMHSTGGRGLTENFLGLDSSDDGTGHMYTLAVDAPVQVTPEAGLRVFGMATWVRSHQVDEMDPSINRDRRMYLKWGAEPSYRVTPKVTVSARYDRVILDLYDAENSFRVLSPRVTFPLDGWGELFVMYSHYMYGDKIHLRPGQIPLETEPDSDVVKLQAQVVW
ncbi:MAG: hypothetical protein H6708_22830 [Kofleriaceae bacterium]|nr:hypothetical protein [Kofleriaceae bacterium]